MTSNVTTTVLDLFERMADGVYTLGYRLLGDRHLAEDVVQETFLAALRSIVSYRGDGPIEAWLYRIAYRAAVAQQRKRRDFPTDPVDMVGLAGAGSADVERSIITLELAAALDRAIEALAPPLRAAFVLRQIEGLSTRDVAHALDVSESSVKMRLSRARTILRAELKEYL